MKYKNIQLLAALAALACLAGCQLAQPMPTQQGQDRLAGILVTTEHLEIPHQDPPEITLQNGQYIVEDPESGRLYAAYNQEDSNYHFEGVEGILYLETEQVDADGNICNTSQVSEGLSNASIHLTSNEGEKLEMEGTIYVSAWGEGASIFYFNPIYQQADGQVYVESGSAASFSGDQSQGTKYRQELTDIRTETVDGETKSSSSVIGISIELIDKPGPAALVELNKNNEVVRRTDLAFAQMPVSFVLDAETAWCVVEQQMQGREGVWVQRTLAQPGDTGVDAFRLGEKGICSLYNIPLEWPQSEVSNSGQAPVEPKA